MVNYEDWAEEELEEVVCVECGSDSQLYTRFQEDVQRCEDCWIDWYQSVMVTED